MPGIEYANAACVLENMVLAATDQKIDSILWDGAVAAVKRLRSLKCRKSIPFLQTGYRIKNRVEFYMGVCQRWQALFLMHFYGEFGFF